MERRRVVTGFLKDGSRVFLLRRSGRVGTYQGRWAGVSGYIEEAGPRTQVLQEVAEETGLPADRILSVAEAPVLEVADETLGVVWEVHPFLVEVNGREGIRLDEEHVDGRWVEPDDLAGFHTVPGLAEALRRALLAGIRADRRRGAAELAREAARAFRFAARTAPGSGEDIRRLVRQTAREVRDLRPSMTPLRHAARWAEAGAATSPREAEPDMVRESVARMCDAFLDASARAATAAAREAATLLAGKTCVLTHSLSSTVLAALAAVPEGQRPMVVATESRPPGEGLTTARRLLDLGYEVTLVADAAVAATLGAEAVEAVVVGADTLLPDGSVVNKAGTALFALAARKAGLPVWVVAESFKLRDDLPPGQAPGLEEGPAEEFYPAGAIPPGLRLRNLSFDVTPADAVTAIVTEHGPTPPGRVTPPAPPYLG